MIKTCFINLYRKILNYFSEMERKDQEKYRQYLRNSQRKILFDYYKAEKDTDKEDVMNYALVAACTVF